MTKDKAASTEELTDKKRPFWKRPALFVSVLFWLFVWFNYYEEILLLAPITFPTFFALLFFSVLTLRSAKYKLIGIFFWSAPLTLLLIMTFSQLVSFVIPASFTYYLGIDVMTPRGLKTCQS
ncbi:membrane protein of unknown function [Pseudodesulfovibrio profundus]|uniref:Uncharacterized protein n=1 Tax=Pseudodesulfovibrio profundus TaxID=57320 RepID=A0A2C8FCA5_9BACT|nr:hypothetical protein [Pseudodesulfovibrio profundus]SOB60077.1 membrane protein of unknown function [Pseudodesulfovibrio profundus]